MAASRLDDLVQALTELDAGEGSKATSVRLPVALHRAAHIAMELGMDESFTAATSRALEERVRAFARRGALAEHYARFPHDRPPLAAVARRRVRGSQHPAARHPELIEEAAAWVERKVPDWATTGTIDETVDQVLEYVEMLAAGVGSRQQAML